MDLFRSSTAVAVLALTAACGRHEITDTAGTDVPVTGPGQGAHVTLAPAASAIGLGDSVQLHATVEGVAGNSQAVRWSVTPSTFTVSENGMVRARCYPGGTATVVATSVVDTTAAGGARVETPPPFTPPAYVAAVTQAGTGEPASLNAVTDSIRVTTSIQPLAVPCYSVTEANLVLRRPSGDTTLARFPLDTTTTDPYNLRFTLHTDAMANGAPVFPNGDYALRVDAVVSGSIPIQESPQVNFTIQN